MVSCEDPPAAIDGGGVDVSHIVPNDVRDPRSEPGLIIDIDLSTADPVREPWTWRFCFRAKSVGKGLSSHFVCGVKE